MNTTWPDVATPITDSDSPSEQGLRWATTDRRVGESISRGTRHVIEPTQVRHVNDQCSPATTRAQPATTEACRGDLRRCAHRTRDRVRAGMVLPAAPRALGRPAQHHIGRGPVARPPGPASSSPQRQYPHPRRRQAPGCRRGPEPIFRWRVCQGRVCKNNNPAGASNPRP
jgi:hypothetical protein